MKIQRKVKRRPGGRSGEAAEKKPRAKKFRNPNARQAFQEHLPSQEHTRATTVVDAFSRLWTQLFSEPVHLDSALSKQTPSLKVLLAQIVPVILMRPASMAEGMGVGIPAGEPWNLSQEKLRGWKPARQLAERMYESMSSGIPGSAAIAEDFPPNMVDEWKTSFGSEVADELTSVLGQDAPLSLRASHKIGAKKLLKELTEGGRLPVRASVSDFVTTGVRLSGYAQVLRSELYDSGMFEIQDEGSQVMALFALWPERFAPLLQDAPGPVKIPEGKATWLEALPELPPAWTVVDACAGAGGKSLAFADALRGRGRIFSYDTSEKKLQALRRRATRAGYNNIKTLPLKQGSEVEAISKFRAQADVVLVDAPCSGWGVLRRNPDIKWRQSPDVLERMPGIQLRLLSQYSSLVKPGGRLVFGVCTFRHDETRAVVEKFLAEHPEFEPRDGGYLGPGPCDGFFMQGFARTRAKKG